MLEIAARAAAKSYYQYQPSQGVAGVACGLFGLGLAMTLYLTIRHKAWIWLVMGFATLSAKIPRCQLGVSQVPPRCVLTRRRPTVEVVGYAVRAISAGSPAERTPYIIQFMLTVLAPVFMAGIIYVVFGRIVFHVVPASARSTKLLWLPPRWLTPIFVGVDIFALLLQLVGAVMIAGTQAADANAAQKLRTGKNVALSGVTAQISAFGLFSILAARFHFTSRRFKAELERRFRAVPGNKLVTLEGGARKFRPNWQGLLWVVNASCALILIRSLYREVEFALGSGGYTNQHEYCLYVFDALPMLGVVILYNVFPPGAYVDMGLRQPKEDTWERVDTAVAEEHPWPLVPNAREDRGVQHPYSVRHHPGE